MPIKNCFAQSHAEITAWRRHLHMYPELMFDVHNTANFVVEKLKEFGVDEITTGIGQSGVVAVINGRQNSRDRVVALRADMDALPIQEETGLEYASKNSGLMHACGHDGHTAMLLGAAQYLAQTRNFDGQAVLIFQPAEETGGGGEKMCQDGMMDRWNIQEVYGMHNMPELEENMFAICEGAIMGSSDEFDLILTGKAGHAAIPHDAIDPNIAAAHIILALQSVVSRTVDPLNSAVVSVCALKSDTEAYNIIPQKVHLNGTMRTLNATVRSQVQARIKHIISHTAAAHGCEADLTFHSGYPVTVNSAKETQYAIDVAHRINGNVDRNTAPLMASEDFSYMLQERPGAYILLGAGGKHGVHHAKYDFNDEIIPAGCSWYAEMIEQRMPLDE